MCMMIVTLFAIILFIDPTNLTILQMPQIRTTQDIARDTYEMSFAIIAALYSPLAKHIQTIAGKITLNRHTRMFRVFRRQLWVSAGSFTAVSSIRYERTR